MSVNQLKVIIRQLYLRCVFFLVGVLLHIACLGLKPSIVLFG